MGTRHTLRWAWCQCCNCLLLLLLLQEVKGLKSTIAKMESMARQKEALLADKTALADQLQVRGKALSQLSAYALPECASIVLG